MHVTRKYIDFVFAPKSVHFYKDPFFTFGRHALSLLRSIHVTPNQCIFGYAPKPLHLEQKKKYPYIFFYRCPQLALRSIDVTLNQCIFGYAPKTIHFNKEKKPCI